MGRKSALTEKQWQTIEKKILGGASVRGLATEYGISEAAIRKRLGTRTKDIKTVAHQLVEAETAFQNLPISAQISARTLADDLKAISSHLAGAAKFGAATAHRLAGIANAQIDQIDDAKPFGDESLKVIKGIAALSNVANLAAEIPMGLLKANKDTINDLNKPPAGKGDDIPREPEYKLVTDEAMPNAPIL